MNLIINLYDMYGRMKIGICVSEMIIFLIVFDIILREYYYYNIVLTLSMWHSFNE